MGLASEIVMIDVNEEKSLGEALDIKQATPFIDNCDIYAGSYADAVGSDVVIITSGIGRKPGQSRLELVQTNIGIIKQISAEIVKAAPNAIYILVANPVDILTYVFMKETGLPKNQIVGTGTMLDSNRLLQAVAQYCNVDVSNVNAYVFGEHGSDCMIPWSLCTVCGMPIRDYCTKIMGVNEAELETELNNIYTGMVAAGSKVIKAKGATFYAVSASVCHICRSLLGGVDTPLTVSTMLHGEYGIDDVAMSLLTVVGRKGAHNKVMIPLTDDEVKQFHIEDYVNESGENADNPAAPVKFQIDLEEGEEVIVVGGAFDGTIGEVESIDTENSTVKIRYFHMGRMAAMEFPADQVKQL